MSPPANNDQPLVTHIFTADPSAHVFNNRLYIYPSHDIDAGIEDNDNGDQYAMSDYHVLSLPSLTTTDPPVITDHGVALRASDIPWVSKQLWAPDAATKDGKYYLYFPARDKQGIFRIGVAISNAPEGPFTPDPEPIPGTYSIDPAVFVDADGQAYLYTGGLWGGQLQCWLPDGTFNAALQGPQEPRGATVPALLPRVALLAADMRSLASPTRQLEIRDQHGALLAADDHDRRFFEAAWMHRRGHTYYFSYSTGDSHLLVYATGSSPWGPFTFRGCLLEPVQGWTTHHSIVEFEGKWWLFYHDASLSQGRNHLRCVKVREVVYDDAGAMSCV